MMIIRQFYPYLFMALILLVFGLVGNEDAKTEAQLADFLNGKGRTTLEKPVTGHPAVSVFWGE